MKLMNKKYTVILALAFVAITIIMRLIDHPWNFSPMGALFLFSGFALPRKWMLLPLVALAFTDAIIGTYQWQVMMTVYGTYAVMLFSARAVRRINMTSVLGMSVASAVLFFITTNFAHWMWFGGYAHNLSGLVQAYVAAIPFFRNSLMGYVFYSALFFAIREIVIISTNAVKVIKGMVIYPNCRT